MVDAIGRRHQPAGPGARIVSLVPSLTELLFDLGLGDAVVGRTTFCVHPAAAVKRVRSVGGTKRINEEKLRALNPTHVLVNIDETPKPLADALEAAGITVVVTHPIEVGDNLALYALIGGIFDRAEPAAALARAFGEAFDRLTRAAAAWPPRRVLYLIWKEPWMTVTPATYIARMLAMARMTVIDTGAGPPVRYPEVALSEALLERVDLVMFPSEPFPFTPAHLDAVRAAFPAHAGKVIAVDGEMLSWYGSRAVAGLDYLCDLGERLAAG